MKGKVLRVLLLALLAAVLCAGAFAEQTDETRVNDYLRLQAGQQKDPWMAAVYEAGAQNVTWNGETATFFLRGFDPDLKALGAYARAEDKDAWRQEAFANM